MCQNWSQVKLYLDVLKNDEHEMPIKNICKTTLNFFFIRLSFCIFEKVSFRIRLVNNVIYIH